jgi:hypothetical protein
MSSKHTAVHVVPMQGADVPSCNDTDTSKVPGVELARGGVVGVDTVQDCPSGKTDTEDRSGRQGSGLVSVREGRHEEHEYQCDGVRRDREQLSLDHVS